VQGHGEERDGHLLARGEQHVHLARIGAGETARRAREAVGRLAHGGDDHDH
jgi:hypothetical protein